MTLLRVQRTKGAGEHLKSIAGHAHEGILCRNYVSTIWDRPRQPSRKSSYYIGLDGFISVLNIYHTNGYDHADV